MTKYNAVSKLSSIRIRFDEMYKDLVELTAELKAQGFDVEDTGFNDDCPDLDQVHERFVALEESLNKEE